jgi:hypothetical protein
MSSEVIAYFTLADLALVDVDMEGIFVTDMHFE